MRHGYHSDFGGGVVGVQLELVAEQIIFVREGLEMDSGMQGSCRVLSEVL